MNSRRARWLVLTLVFIASCDPAEQSRSTDALVTRSGDGFIIEIPSCGGRGVGGFDLSPGGSRWLEFRSNPDHPSGDRIVRLVVTEATLSSRDFGPEVKLLSATGSSFTSPGDITYIRLNTDVGYAEFDPHDLTFANDGRAVVHGKSSRPATKDESGEGLVVASCR
ncbi:MAG: hypothetical protein Q7V57_05055 [Actinomycetota bacterium]|nr:hypothetical protein [Actinomycetota bacterium]